MASKVRLQKRTGAATVSVQVNQGTSASGDRWVDLTVNTLPEADAKNIAVAWAAATIGEKVDPATIAINP